MYVCFSVSMNVCMYVSSLHACICVYGNLCTSRYVSAYLCAKWPREGLLDP